MTDLRFRRFLIGSVRLLRRSRDDRSIARRDQVSVATRHMFQADPKAS
jgi:hypothetical protein